MADIAAVVIRTLQWVGAPVTRQFQYLCCFSRNITNLRNEANQLEGTTQDLQRKVDTAKNDLRVISSGVEIWLQDSNDIENETRGILDEVSNVESGCFKLGARFFLSRRAKKTTDRVKELRGRSNFQADDISQPAPPPATKAVPLSKTYNFDSRKKIEEDIMTTLRGEDVNMVGICGMGGLGKTTMAKRIMNRALEEHVFEEVVMAVISQTVEESKIQLEIGGLLGLKLEGETLQVARAQKLHERLCGTKRTLLILDDVWEELVLGDLGIPHGYKGCTILLTTRDRQVLSAMNVEKIFGMEVLSEEDSWFLFKERAGICVDDTKLNSIAKEVVSECAGLPIVLITVGAALNGAHVSIWKNALQRLKINCTPDIPKYIEKVYIPLKLSYDVLERKYQDVFLLCCLYPEDDDIPLEQLTYFCMGLRLLEGAIGNVEDTRNRIRALTNVLKSRSLLLDSEDGDDYVRSYCYEMVEVIKDEEEKGMSGGGQTALLFPKLQKLGLLHLPKLVSFCESKGIESIQFPVLRSMQITKCKKMKGTVANGVTSNENNSGGSSTNAADIIHLFCQSKQVSFGCLKKLSTDRNPFCSHTIHVSIFNGLEELEISRCPGSVSLFDRLEELYIFGYKGSMSLFSSSITGNLVNLTTLIISSSHKMVKVIEEKEEEKEKVVSGAQRTTILFPKLHKIVLIDLPELVRFCEWNVELPSLSEVEIKQCRNMKSFTLGPLNTPKLQKLMLFALPELVRFCEWKCDVELPSLTEVAINQCHNMKSFTLGPLNTPKLESVKINRKEFGGVKDLNDILQQQYINRTEVRTTNILATALRDSKLHQICKLSK